MFLVGVKKNFIASFLDIQEMDSRSNWKANVGKQIYVNLRKKSFASETWETFIWWRAE